MWIGDEVVMEVSVGDVRGIKRGDAKKMLFRRAIVPILPRF